MTFYNRKGILYIRINGKRLSTKLKDTSQNRKLVKSYYKNDEFFKKFDVKKSIPTVCDLCIEVLKEKETELKRNSYSAYESMFNSNIKPFFNGLVNEYEPIDIFNWYKAFKDRSSLNTCEAVLKPAFEKAILKGYIKTTPFIISKPKFNSDYEINPFSLDELEKILTSKDSFFVNYCGVACFTGLRTGELLGLKWSDIDFKNNKISISRTATGGRLQSPKTKSSKAIIDLPIESLPYFKNQRLKTGLKEFIFVSSQNKNYLYSTYLNTKFKKFLTSLDIEIRTIYQTRHTFASLKLSIGERLEWVSYMLRHINPDTTLKKYFKYIPDLNKDRIIIDLSQKRHTS